MRIGIIAEGPADLAVVTNVLIGALGVSRHEVQPLRPDLYLDETDLHTQAEGRFSNWELVRHECRAGSKIADFMASPIDDGPRYVVVQIDTAEAHLYDVTRPDKPARDLAEFADLLRTRVVDQILTWLDPAWHPVTAFAVAIEEIDAWVLTVWEPGRDSVSGGDPKQRLQREWSARVSEKDRRRLTALKTRSEYGLFDELSKDLRKPKQLQRFARDNLSLLRFIESLSQWRPADT